MVEKKLRVERKVLSGVLCRVRSPGNLRSKVGKEEIHCLGALRKKHRGRPGADHQRVQQTWEAGLN